MSSDCSQPNILLIMCDQLSAFATSPYGNQDVLTPHLSELAQRGTVFERTYCNSPLCAPSRASMMTGQLASQIPVNDNSEELPASAATFVHHLRRGGYLTVLSGKMHFVGPDQLHGFEERLTTDIYPSDYMWTKYWPAQGDPPRRVGLPGDDEGDKIYQRQMSQMVKEAGLVPWNYQLEYDEEVHFRSLERLRQLARRRGETAEQPWLLCVSYTQPHDPYVSTHEYWDRYEGIDFAMPEEPPTGHDTHRADIWTNSFHGLDHVKPTQHDTYRARRGYYAMTSYIDDKVGELIRELERLGQADNTLIVFTSDHGDQVGEHGMWHKRTVREWSARVPLIVAGPRVAQGYRVTENVSLVDLYPTLGELAALEMPHDFAQYLDGHSLVPLMRDDDSTSWDNRVVIENNGEATIKPIRALVKGSLKLVYVKDHREQLFDLEKDPNEWFNVVDDPAYKQALNQLRSELLEDWDPEVTERQVLASQRHRMLLKEALYKGKYEPWDYQAHYEASGAWVRRTSDAQWDPHLGL